MEELKPCPFCGGKDLKFSKVYSWICCKNKECQVEGPMKRTEEKAIEAWNRRV